jgi:thiol-disulfide isomerase/thioredoxin
MEPMKKKSTKQNYVLKGTINGDFGEFIKIRYDTIFDSIKVKNNTFKFEGEVSSPKAFQFEFDSITSSNVFYLENDTLVFDIVVDKIQLENETFNEYSVKQLSGGETQRLKSEIQKFISETQKSKKNRDLLLQKMDSLIKAYPNHDYLGKVLYQFSMNQDLLYNDIRSLISKLDVNELNSQDVAILEKYQQKRRKFQVGSEIPPYQLLSITGETEDLKSNFSTYNLIQFWNSWCEKCKSQQGELLALYKKYNFKGFEIIGISLDTNRKDWITSVSEESVPWKSLRVENWFTGEMASEMGIVELPQYYLVDKNGRIIEINLSLEELDSILSVLIN